VALAQQPRPRRPHCWEPFDLAMFFVRTVDQSHAHDNPRMYSVAGLVDGGGVGSGAGVFCRMW